MDLNQNVWDTLRANGHTLGVTYFQDGVGLLTVVDGVPMSVRNARAVSLRRATVAQIAEATSQER